jgi:hypothetical protein
MVANCQTKKRKRKHEGELKEVGWVNGMRIKRKKIS